MSNKYLQEGLLNLVHNMTILSGYADIASDASVSASVIQGGAITKTGTGEYTFTMSESYNSGVVCQCELQAATAVDLSPQIKSFDPVGAKTLVVNLLTAATPTNPAAACRLYVYVVVRNSSVVR